MRIFHKQIFITVLMTVWVTFNLVYTLGLSVRAVNVPNYEVQWGCATNESINDPEFGCPSEVDIVTGPWLLDGWKPYHTTWLNKFSEPQNATKTPYIFAYMIAGLARRDKGLSDCDLSTKSVCTDGANYIRENIISIEEEYTNAAENILQAYGNKEIYIHLEPDFYLYHRSALQKNPLSMTEAHQLMNRLSNTFHSRLPNVKLVMDVSAWSPDLTIWHSGFTNIDYGGMVGKPFYGNVAPDGKSYEQIKELVGLPIVVDTAHTFGGFFTPYNATWETSNNGVHAVIQAPTNNLAYSEFLQSVRMDVVTIPFYKVKTF
jgi:hypothetical protein